MPSEPETSSAYARINLNDLEDVAVPNGFGHRWEAHAARAPLGAQHAGLTHFRLRAGKRSPFSHRYTQIYVILQGGGRVKLDEEVFEVRPRDAIRVAPGVARACEAGPDGLEFVATGPDHPGDGEQVDDPWVK
jgi:quercetin dioxygenase-like cupin family protein